MRAFRRPRLHATTILFVVLALCVPKLSFAFAALGGGTHSVVLCTGTGLVRVTVTADGDIVDASADAFDAGARHCDLVQTALDDVELRWRAIGESPRHLSSTHVPAGTSRRVERRAAHDAAPRGPPPVG